MLESAGFVFFFQTNLTSNLPSWRKTKNILQICNVKANEIVSNLVLSFDDHRCESSSDKYIRLVGGKPNGLPRIG